MNSTKIALRRLTNRSRQLPPPLDVRDLEESQPKAKKSAIKNPQWQYYLKWSMFFSWISLLGGVLSFLVLLTILTSSSGGVNSRFDFLDEPCKPGGTFRPFYGDYDWWTGSGFFEINLGMGKLSFTEAKVIDIFWDTIVGRGGQAAIGYISWVALSNYVAVTIQRSPVSYATFWGIFLRQESSAMGIFCLIKERSFYRVLRSKVVIAFTIMSLLLVLAFPTLASAMTGYALATDAYIPQKTGSQNLIPFSDFDQVAYVIHDGWRVNGTGNDILPLRYYSPMTEKTSSMVYKRADSALGECHKPTLGACSFALSAVSRYVTTYGFYGLNTTTDTVFNNSTVPGPPLNISAYYLVNGAGSDWIDPRTGERPFRNQSNILYAYGNDTYTLTEILSVGGCQPLSEQYQWGFAYVQMFIVTMLLIIWTAGTWLMWLKAHLNNPSTQYGQVSRGWRCLLHMASVMREELASARIDPNTLTDEQLALQIQARLKGGNVSLEPADEAAVQVGILQYWRKNIGKVKWALISSAIHLPLLVFAVYFAVSMAEYDNYAQHAGYLYAGHFVITIFLPWVALLSLLLMALSGARRRWYFLHLILFTGANCGAWLHEGPPGS